MSATEASSDERSYVSALESAGYVLRIREADWHEHRMFKGPDTNLNLHVFSPGCIEIDRMLGFRDWLRTHPDDRALYERTKRDLASSHWKHVQNYANAKTEVVEQILARAMAAPRGRLTAVHRRVWCARPAGCALSPRTRLRIPLHPRKGMVVRSNQAGRVIDFVDRDGVVHPDAA